jgi:hypothetical protein
MSCAHFLACVRSYYDLSLVCVAFPPLLLCFLCNQHCKGERLQFVEIPRKREKNSKVKDHGIQAEHWTTGKGLRQPSSIRTPQHGSR